MKSVVFALAAPLALIGAFSATVYLSYREIVDSAFIISAEPITIVVAGFLALPGFLASKRGFRDGARRKALAVVGIHDNVLIFILGLQVFGFLLFTLAQPSEAKVPFLLRASLF